MYINPLPLRYLIVQMTMIEVPLFYLFQSYVHFQRILGRTEGGQQHDGGLQGVRVARTNRPGSAGQHLRQSGRIGRRVDHRHQRCGGFS